MISWFDRWIIWRLNFIWSTLRSGFELYLNNIASELYLKHIAPGFYLKHIALGESQLENMLESQRSVNRLNSMISGHLLERERKWHEEICGVGNFDIDIWNIINFLRDDVAETRQRWASMNIITRIGESKPEITWLRIWLAKLGVLITENGGFSIICL